MTSRLIETKKDLDLFLKLPGMSKYPFTLTYKKGKNRSPNQNDTSFMWYLEAAQQLGDESAEDKRAFCKLHYGVPILRASNVQFRDAYDKYIRPLDYQTKLAMMKTPLDWPVTRMMNTKEFTEYLDIVHVFFTEQGVKLTVPNE